MKFMGFSQLPPDSYREVKILHCQECNETEKEMIQFRNKMTIYLPLVISIFWMLIYSTLWFIYTSISLTELFIPSILVISTLIFLIFVFWFFPRTREYSRNERIRILHRFMLKNDYSRLLLLYQFFSALITILFPLGIPVLLLIALYNIIIDSKNKIDVDCFFKRIPQQCHYCSGGTSFRNLKKTNVHYYRHSENCSIFLRGWVE